MKRLTKYLASGAADYNYPADCYGGNDCNDRAAKSAYRQTCVERLAAYEDTGLTPEEVLPKDKADEIALKLMRLAEDGSREQYGVNSSAFGKTVFVTSEEAEKALKTKEG